MWLNKETKNNKEEMYRSARESIKLMLSQEQDEIVKMSTIAAVLKKHIPYYLWVGFYRLQGDELLVGPYMGNPACLHIPLGKGACGRSATTKKTIIIDEVKNFPGYISCDSKTESEIVVPVINSDDKLIGVLDVDSQLKGAFDNTDKKYLEVIVKEMFSSSK